MSVAIVSTSINPDPTAYEGWSKQGDLIVAGDVNAPRELREFVTSVGGRYLSARDQMHWPFSESLGWACVQRRNAAVMQAYADGYDYVVTVDDDNVVPDGWVDAHIAKIGDTLGREIAFGVRGWVDVGQFLDPPTRQRGTPYGVDLHADVREVMTTEMEVRPTVVASMGQPLGDPDCDAITRLTDCKQIRSVTRDVVIVPGFGQWAAFYSQATLWRGDWAPLISVLPYVGRYDDIFAGFIAEAIMRTKGGALYVGSPAVTQVRNPHDYIKDLRNEVYGLQWTLPLCEALERIELWRVEPGDLPSLYATIANALGEYWWFPRDTVRFMLDWAQTWAENLRD